VNSENQKELENLMKKPNFTFVEMQPMELEVKGQSFMIQTSAEHDDFESEENVDIAKSELDPIEIRQRIIPNILRNQATRKYNQKFWALSQMT
jgi:hypothetical protein